MKETSLMAALAISSDSQYVGLKDRPAEVSRFFLS